MNKTKSLILFFSTLAISCTLLVSGCAKNDSIKKSEMQKVADSEMRATEESRLKKEKEDENRRIAAEEEKARQRHMEEERLKAEAERVRLEEEKLEEERMRQAETVPSIIRTTGAETSELRDIRFSYDKADLDNNAMGVLQKNAKWLQENTRVKIQIEGHCDERGTSEYNLALAERRALSAKKYLMSLGVHAERIYTISYGEEMPLDSGHNESAWAKNRRAHFLITSK